jgi:hypothetical protein
MRVYDVLADGSEYDHFNTAINYIGFYTFKNVIRLRDLIKES